MIGFLEYDAGACQTKQELRCKYDFFALGLCGPDSVQYRKFVLILDDKLQLTNGQQQSILLLFVLGFSH